MSESAATATATAETPHHHQTSNYKTPLSTPLATVVAVAANSEKTLVFIRLRLLLRPSSSRSRLFRHDLFHSIQVTLKQDTAQESISYTFLL